VIVGRPLIRLTETGSTMDLASRLAGAGTPAGTAVLAGLQTAGRGRAGRSWATAPGTSILMSFVADTQRPQGHLGALSLLLGLAVSQVIETFSGSRTTIKWPNDVLVDSRKIAGILVVNRAVAGRPGNCLIAGIGLNVNDRPADLPATGTSLAILTGGPHPLDDILRLLLANLTETMMRFEQGDTGEMWTAIEDRLAFRGERVRIDDAGRTVEGTLRGVTRAGLLELELASGDLVRIASGDLTKGPAVIG